MKGVSCARVLQHSAKHSSRQKTLGVSAKKLHISVLSTSIGRGRKAAITLTNLFWGSPTTMNDYEVSPLRNEELYFLANMKRLTQPLMFQIRIYCKNRRIEANTARVSERTPGNDTRWRNSASCRSLERTTRVPFA